MSLPCWRAAGVFAIIASRSRRTAEAIVRTIIMVQDVAEKSANTDGMC
jgi:hypothetical protein